MNAPVEYRGVVVSWEQSAAVDAPDGQRLVIARDAKGHYWAHVPEGWTVLDVLDAFTRSYVCDYSLSPTVFVSVRDGSDLVDVVRAQLDEDGEAIEITSRAWPFVAFDAKFCRHEEA